MARERNYASVSVRIDDLNRLKEMSENTGLSISDVINWMIPQVPVGAGLPQVSVIAYKEAQKIMSNKPEKWLHIANMMAVPEFKLFLICGGQRGKGNFSEQTVARNLSEAIEQVLTQKLHEGFYEYNDGFRPVIHAIELPGYLVTGSYDEIEIK